MGEAGMGTGKIGDGGDRGGGFFLGVWDWEG